VGKWRNCYGGVAGDVQVDELAAFVLHVDTGGGERTCGDCGGRSVVRWSSVVFEVECG
jgi:hypothetical protein